MGAWMLTIRACKHGRALCSSKERGILHEDWGGSLCPGSCAEDSLPQGAEIAKKDSRLLEGVTSPCPLFSFIFQELQNNPCGCCISHTLQKRRLLSAFWVSSSRWPHDLREPPAGPPGQHTLYMAKTRKAY